MAEIVALFKRAESAKAAEHFPQKREQKTKVEKPGRKSQQLISLMRSMSQGGVLTVGWKRENRFFKEEPQEETCATQPRKRVWVLLGGHQPPPHSAPDGHSWCRVNLTAPLWSRHFSSYPAVWPLVHFMSACCCRRLNMSEVSLY